MSRRFWSRQLTTDGQIGLEEMAVADVAFTIAFEFYDVLSAVLTKANDGALICPALGLRVLDEDGLTWIKNWKLLAVLFRILVLTDLAKATFHLGAKDWLVVVDWRRQTISNFTTKEKLGRRIA